MSTKRVRSVRLSRLLYRISLATIFARAAFAFEETISNNVTTTTTNCDHDDDNAGAPWFGATPPSRRTYRPHRKGWDECLRCGGSERLGARLDDVGPLQKADRETISEISDAVRAYGVVVIPGQNLTRAEQVAFTARLGEVVVLPLSMEGKDPEPGYPAIQRVSNFWAGGKWKGPKHGFGGYWHQDGQFHVLPRHNIYSVLHAQKVPATGGETGFADLRAARHGLSRPLLERTADAHIEVSARNIKDFAGGTEEDFALFPEARHPILREHDLDGGDLLYIGSPHCRVGGLATPEAGKELLRALFAHATSPSFTYYHAWEAGDVVLWDNTQTLHHAMPYENDGTVVRELFRTQARFATTTTTTVEGESDGAKEEL